MHEFSLATEIVEIVEKSASNAGKFKVTVIELELGELSGVEEQALLTALKSLMENTIMKDAEIKIQHKKGVAICNECSTKFELNDLYTLCPKCSGFYKDIVSGKEFNVLSIEAE
jgi:hydrogenase nickel incorporation protein HypA/HybF